VTVEPNVSLSLGSVTHADKITAKPGGDLGGPLYLTYVRVSLQ
jgi:hypothetical protein